MAILFAMLIVAANGSIASIGHWAELSGCEASVGEVVDYYRRHGVDVYAECERLPPWEPASERR